MIYINDKEVNFIYNLGEKVKEVFSYGTKIWPKEVLFDYMYFKLADGYTSGNVSYKFDEYYNLHNKYLKISTDGRNWNDWTEAISMTQNVKYYVKGEDSYVRNSDISGGFFSSDVSTQNFNIECGGNVMSLCNMATEINTNYCFRTLFQYMANLVTPPKLPATTLSDYCYFGMFFDCSSLTQAPELPATIMKPSCYLSMFMGCKSLTVAPELQSTTLANSCYQNLLRGTGITTAPALPATTLADGCYYSIFENCSSLTKAPELPATTLTKECYRTMFTGCSSLTQSPALPATTLANGCYTGMFKNCTSLTQSPALPATTLANSCYTGMFQGCTSLTQAPELPATTLADYCYKSMFQGCSSLTQAHALPATTLAKSCYGFMFSNCSSLTQAPELPATTLANNCYYSMFYGCTALTQSPELPATILASKCYDSMLSNSNKLNWIKALFTNTPSPSYTNKWVNGVSSQGVFVKNINATWTTTGVNAVPTGWTVIYFDQTEGKYYTTNTKEVECDKYGNVKQEIDAMYFKLADGYTSGNVSYKFDEYYNLHNKYLKISTDGNNWSDWTEQISMAPNTKYFVNGEDSYVRNSYIGVGFFSSDVSTQNFNIECGGNVMSLCNNATEINTQYCFCSLFYDMKNLLTTPSLTATTLAKECYRYMFNNCSSLTQAPALPATTLAYGCYWSMFSGCSSLTQAPALPVTTLATTCYNCMFENCSSLTQAPALPATTLTDYCYTGMFSGCSKLTQVPELPATTLADSCYSSMFYGCSSLTQATALPVTTLADYCYTGMFSGCSSLTEAPELPATTLTMCCYMNMFDGCSSLTQAPALPATTLEIECYEYMFSNCSSLTQSPELQATTLTDYCYSGMFSGCSSLTQAPVLTATTLASDCYTYMFSDCTSLTEITLNGDFNSSYATDWVSNVSQSGTFYNNSDLDIPVGVNGIPEGWTEIRPVTSHYMYFKLADGAENGNVGYQFDEYYNLHNKYLKISTDVNNWQDWTETISMVPNTKYFVKGEDSYVRNSNISSGFFTSDVSQNQFNIKCGGNVMSLCNMATEITTNYCFIRLFYNMTNLLTPPKLPATTLANFCYGLMFRDCSSLTQAPELPATTLANSCYTGMFQGCTSLTQAPELPATTLADYCYKSMFYNSKKLNWIKALFTTKLGFPPYTLSWVNGVSAQGVFVKNINATWTNTGANAVPSGWTVIYYDQREDKYFTTNHREVECDKYGNPL